MLVTLSGAAVAAIGASVPHVKIDCGIKIRAEGMTRSGSYIFQPSQLKMAGVPRLHIIHLSKNTVTSTDGKVFNNVCVIRPQFVIRYG